MGWCGIGRLRTSWVLALAVAFTAVASPSHASGASGLHAPAPMARSMRSLTVPAGTRVLVIAPHPDDESLAAGGLMQRVRAAGGTVHVGFMTNGDGYPEAVALAKHHVTPTATDYRAFGERRRHEARAALERYGIDVAATTFLGFPDGGLAAIWSRGARRGPYLSPFTAEDTPPYPGVFDPHARYLRRDLVAVLMQLIAVVEPDWLVVPSPVDTHGDHCATFSFVLDAMQALAREPGGAGKLPSHLLAYVVHAGNWPPPSTVAGRMPAPPKSFPAGRWYSLTLAPGEVTTKLEAVRHHRTQAAVMDRLFVAFARGNEVFAVVPRDDFDALAPAGAVCGREIVPHGSPVASPPLVSRGPAARR
jgi:LmbE family N-acetylglucosaminyl deacetylase